MRSTGIACKIRPAKTWLLAVGVLAGCGHNDAGSSGSGASNPYAGLTWTYVGTAVTGPYADADAVEVSAGAWRIYCGVIPEQVSSLDIFSASSGDGTLWSEDAGTRVTSATFPDVVRLPDGSWRMYFQGMGDIVSARSEDGLAFQKEEGIRVAKGDGWDQVAASTTARRPDGTWIMVYRALVGKTYSPESINSDTMVLISAESPDGLTFTTGPIIVETRNSLYLGSVDGPDLVVMDDGKLHLFYWTPAGKYNQQDAGIYEMVSDDFGRTWAAPVLVVPVSYQIAQSGGNWGDPTVVKIGSVWHMYFGRMDGIHEAILK